MSWLFNKNSTSSSLPPSTPLEQQRIKQIKSLSSNNQNVIEIKRDNEYKVAFQSAGKALTLNVLLPPQFPNEKPIIHVSPYIKHPWVDEYMRIVGCQPLNMFFIHSDLGKIVQQIVKEFKKHPPQFINVSEFQMPPVAPGFPSTYSENMTSLIGDVNINKSSSLPDYSTPNKGLKVQSKSSSPETEELETIMKRIKDLDMKALNEVINNPDVQLSYVQDLNIVKDLQDKRTEMVERNEEIAKQNISLEPVIDDLKGDLKFLFEEYNELYHKFQEKVQKQHEFSQIYDINHISTNLRISILQAEEEAENITEQFNQGSLNVDKFLSDFVATKKLYHLRRAKEEKLKKCLPSY